MSIDWSVLTHFPLDDKERLVSSKETDPRVKGGDGSGPFRILSLANSADAEAILTPARRVYLAGSPFINLAVFKPHSVKYDNRCESDGGPSRIREDKSRQKKRARGHQPSPERLQPLARTVCKSNHRDNTVPPARICYNTYSQARVFPRKFADYSCGGCDALCRIVNSLNKYVSQFAANMFFLFFFPFSHPIFPIRSGPFSIDY